MILANLVFPVVLGAFALQPVLMCSLMILGGALGAAGFIVSKKPNAKELIDKLTPFGGFIGIGLLVLGIWGLITFLPHVGTVMSAAPLTGIVALGAMVICVGLGFLLGFGLISQYVLSGSEEAKKKGEDLRAKLTTFQIPMGLASIVLGAWFLINTLML
jgi:hypothetical protein